MLDKLKNEVTVAIAFSSGALIVTGYGMTWARIAGEGLPTQPILSALPDSFFLQAAVQSMAAPLVVSVFLGSLWVPLAVLLRRGLHISLTRRGIRVRRDLAPASAAALRGDPGPGPVDRWWIAGCALFGLLVGCTAALLVGWVNVLPYHDIAPTARTSGILVLSAGLSAFLGWLIANFRPVTWRGWEDTRPILAATLALCVVVTCGTRIHDARLGHRALPYTQVIADGACLKATNGVTPDMSEDVSGDPAELCQVGGFYLGSDDSTLFLVQRQGCSREDGPPPGPQLVMVSRAEVDFVLVRTKTPAPPNCEGQ